MMPCLAKRRLRRHDRADLGATLKIKGAGLVHLGLGIK
jgi:hypothetical protein